MPILVTPTTDLHLLLGGPSMTLKVIYLAPDGSQTDITATATYAGFTNATIVHGVVTATAEGEVLGRIVHGDVIGLMRIWVHERISDLWFGNERLSIFAGRASQPTVHATFNDLVAADVTDHPYLHFATSAAAFTVDAATGRIDALPASAGQTGIVTVSAPGVADPAELEVRVRDSIDTERPILTPAHYRGRADDKTNLLIIAEGYEDGDVFLEHVRQLLRRLFESPAHSPYLHLRDAINVWTAFEPSPSAGITVGPETSARGQPIPFLVTVTAGAGPQPYSLYHLIDLVGMPRDASPTTLDEARDAWTGRIPGFERELLVAKIFEEWLAMRVHGLLTVKDSTLGMMYGDRIGDPVAREVNPEPSLAGSNFPFFRPRRRPHILSRDIRRNLDLGFEGLLAKYVASLRYSTDASHPDHMVARHWAPGAKDTGLVGILVNDTVAGGATWWNVATRARIGFPIAMGRDQAFRLSGTAPRLDHVVDTRKPVYDAVAGIFAHETAHGFGLGDEYENTDSLPRPGEMPPENWADADDFDNLTHRSNVSDEHGVVPARIKWNWHRVAQASPIISAATSPATGDTITIQLAPGEGIKWRKVKADGREVFLRNPDLNEHRTRPRLSTTQRSEALRITEITGDSVTLGGDRVGGHGYPAGSVLYLPKLDKQGKARTVIDSAVRQKLFASDGFGAHADGRVPCNQYRREGDAPPKDIPGFSQPDNRERVIGLYAGGGGWNCGVYRPAGHCKLRAEEFREAEWRWWLIIPYRATVTRQRGFCFVCKYLIINRINPAAFDLLDREYPEDC